ncbi:uncharacterized protein LOC105914394 [Setaria italica]|uniref:uncharacterized protein LOC105914394 n=1 Tax=Setaria italica TaxID=4555 RepID=UPI000647C76A|nr:uncharacterized protein LOC105914394 [Setaria italica]
MIRRDQKFKKMTPNQLLGEILHQELVEKDVAKSLSLKKNKGVALNASSSVMVEPSHKTSKPRKEDSRDDGSTNEETALVLRNFKKFMKKKGFKKDGNDRKETSQRRYKCKELGHYIADCPNKNNKDNKEKRYKERSKDYKKKYQGHAHVGQEWDSSDEDSDKECMETLAILKPSKAIESSTTPSTMMTTPLFVS